MRHQTKRPVQCLKSETALYVKHDLLLFLLVMEVAETELSTVAPDVKAPLFALSSMRVTSL
jgi:hypothetical protein